VAAPSTDLLAAIYLGPALENRLVANARTDVAQLVNEFVRRRAAWLEFGATP
jgi:hypothetical protein